MEPDFFILDENLTADELLEDFSTKLEFLLHTFCVSWRKREVVNILHLSVLDHPNLNETIFVKVFDWYTDPRHMNFSPDVLSRLVRSPLLTKDLAEVLIERQPQSHYYLHFRKDLSVKAWKTMIRRAKSRMEGAGTYVMLDCKNILSSAAEQPHLGDLLLEIPWRVMDGITRSSLARNPSCPLELLRDIWCNGDFGWEKGEVEEHPRFELPEVYQVGDPLI